MKRFDRALRELGRERPTEGLGRLVKTPQRRRLLPSAVVAGVATIAVGMWVAGTGSAEARLLDEVVKRAGEVPFEHQVWFDPSTGQPTMELWKSANGMRIERRAWGKNAASTFVLLGNQMRERSEDCFAIRTVSDKIRRMWTRRQVADQIGHALTAKGATMDRITTQGQEMVRIVTNIEDPRPDSLTQATYLIDPQTKLVMEISRRTRSRGTWSTPTRTRLDYPASIPADLFLLKPQAGDTVVDDRTDPARNLARWRRGIETRGPIFLRDVARDLNGGVLVVWSGPAPIKSLRLEDARGKVLALEMWGGGKPWHAPFGELQHCTFPLPYAAPARVRLRFELAMGEVIFDVKRVRWGDRLLSLGASKNLPLTIPPL